MSGVSVWSGLVIYFGIPIVWFGVLCCVSDDKAVVPPQEWTPRYGGRQVKSGWHCLLLEWWGCFGNKSNSTFLPKKLLWCESWPHCDIWPPFFPDWPPHPPTHPYLQQISLGLGLASWNTPFLWSFPCPYPDKPTFLRSWIILCKPVSLCLHSSLLWYSLDTCMTQTLVLNRHVLVWCPNQEPACVGQRSTFSAEDPFIGGDKLTERGDHSDPRQPIAQLHSVLHLTFENTQWRKKFTLWRRLIHSGGKVPLNC